MRSWLILHLTFLSLSKTPLFKTVYSVLGCFLWEIVVTETSRFKAKLQDLHPLHVAISIFCLCIYHELCAEFLKESENSAHQVVSAVEAWMFSIYIKKTTLFLLALCKMKLMVGGGFLGRKCARVKNEIVVGHHPVGPWWKRWIIIWMLWVMEVCVLFREGFAEQQGFAGKPVCAPLSWQEEHSPVLLQQGQTLTCWNLIDQLYLYWDICYVKKGLFWRKKNYFCGKGLWACSTGGGWDQWCQA